MKLYFVLMSMLSQPLLSCPDEPGCRQCPMGLTCALCSDSYLNPKKQCVQVSKKIENCEIYSSADNGEKCQVCIPGFYVAEDGKSCSKCNDSNCATCESKGEICLECFSFYRIAGNECQKAKVVRDPFCFISNEKEECSRCIKGFSLNSDNYCEVNIPGCKVLSKNKQKCEICHDGTFITKSGECSGEPKPLPYDDTPSNFLIYFILVVLILAILAACVGCCLCFKSSKKNEETYQPAPEARN